MNKKYDEKLTSIPHFSIHNEMLPFIGEARLILFTSILAGNAYKKNHGKFYDSSRTLYLDHPTSPYWNRCKRGKLSSGKQLEMKLKAYCE